MNLFITGATGSLGTALVASSLRDPSVERVVAFSRDEVKQAALGELMHYHPKLRLFLGDVRDQARVEEALWHCDTVIQCAALKRVDALAYNPSEVFQTNILGTWNVLRAARGRVARVLIISSDKAVRAQNCYGVSKAAAEHLAVNENVYGFPQGTRTSVLRYGNVLGSRGSVIHTWRAAVLRGDPITLTHPEMTRFWLTLDDAVGLVGQCLELMRGGELFVPVVPSMRLRELAEALAPGYPVMITGMRPGGEKLHEELLTDEELTRTVARPDVNLYVVTPAIRTWSDHPYEGLPVQQEWQYRSDQNPWWLSIADMRKLLENI